MFEGRSQFFNLPLMGVGTASTESLRSYIYRLAMAHSLRPKVLVHDLLLRHEALRALSNLDEMFKFMNIHGDGGRANRLLDLFGESTGVDLRVATLGRFRPVLSPTHLVRRKAFYCPDCVRAEGDGTTFPHGHLLWEVDCVTACPEHGVLLRPADACGGPLADRLPLNKRPQHSSVCHSCASIGFRCVTSPPEVASATELWVARQVGRVLALSPETVGQFTGEQLREGIRALVAAKHGGSEVEAALNAELSRNLVWYWARTTILPSLPLLLQLCAADGADIVALLRGQFVESEDPAPSRIRLVQRTYRRMTMTVAELKVALEAACVESPPPTAMGVARRLNMTERRLRLLVPEELAKLVTLNSEHRRSKDGRSYDEAVQAYEDAARALQAEGKYVGEKYLQQRAGLAAFSHNRNRRRALAEVLAKYRSAS